MMIISRRQAHTRGAGLIATLPKAEAQDLVEKVRPC